MANSVTTSSHRPLRRTALAALAAALTLSGCSGSESSGGSADDESSDPAPSAAASPSPESGDGPQLVQGGEPGEEASEVPSDTTVAPQEWSHEDEMFMQMMIPHHAQALEMTELAAEHARDRRVRLLAERIEAAQGPEIAMMAAWLEDRNLRVPRADDAADEFDHGEHGHTEMAGMLTPAQLDKLAAARGTAFDRLFLRYMIGHHEGALEMADETAGGGLDVIAGETRDGVSSSQSAEIARMKQVLADL